MREDPDRPAADGERADMRDTATTADEVIARLGLAPHPEGGHYVETWRDRPARGGRGAGTAIYYLLGAGEVSAWHRIDATEIWHFYAGSPLELRISERGEPPVAHLLGTNLAHGERPQVIVPPMAWQSARSLDAWTLVGCTVSPAFLFERSEMAPSGWEPGRVPEQRHGSASTAPAAYPEWRRGPYLVSTDPARLDLPLVHRFLHDAYWSKGIAAEVVGRSIAGSIAFGLYRDDEQIGFARVVSDRATFAYLCDVFVLEPHRGRGLGVWLTECVLDHPELQGLRRWLLATRDAHGLYRKVGFRELADPGRLMERPDPDVYRRG